MDTNVEARHRRGLEILHSSGIFTSALFPRSIGVFTKRHGRRYRVRSNAKNALPKLQHPAFQHPKPNLNLRLRTDLAMK